MRAAQKVAFYTLLVICVAILLFPLYYTVAGALMSQQELATFPPHLYPHHIVLKNFSDAFRVIPLARQYGNSLLVALVVVFGQVVTAVLSAYAFAFLRMPFRGFVFAVFLVTMMVPGEAIIIPNYLTIAHLHALNTYWALILPYLSLGFGTFLLRQFFLSFPPDIREAALLDGAGHLRFMYRILVPLSKPAIGTLAVYVFISTYNQYFWPLLVTRTPEMQTLQIGVSQLQSADIANPNIVLAGVTLALIPTLALIYAFQRNIVRGLTAGAVR